MGHDSKGSISCSSFMVLKSRLAAKVGVGTKQQAIECAANPIVIGWSELGCREHAAGKRSEPRHWRRGDFGLSAGPPTGRPPVGRCPDLKGASRELVQAGDLRGWDGAVRRLQGGREAGGSAGSSVARARGAVLSNSEGRIVLVLVLVERPGRSGPSLAS